MNYPGALCLGQVSNSIPDDPGVTLDANNEVAESRDLGFTFVVIIHAYTKAADVALNKDLPTLIYSV